MMYSRPKNGATVTIFAPYDCNNACPFCINKKDYAANREYNIDKVKESIAVMNEITPNCDFVITGGEPLANITLFIELVKWIHHMNTYAGGHHKLFVNTTLPIQHDDIAILNQSSNVITGFNISRHLIKYVRECPDEWIEELKIPVRINCVLYTTENIEKAVDFVNRFINFKNVTGFQFRDNYINVNQENLFNMYNNERLDSLKKIFGQHYLYHIDKFRWNVKWTDQPISFHRTQCFSKFLLDDGTTFIGDVIIDPRGIIKDDWNEHGDTLDLELYAAAQEVS